MSRPCGTALLLPLLLLTAGCAGGPQGNPFSGERTPNQLRLQVQNRQFNDATIHAITTSSQRRLGRIPGSGRAEFTIPLDHPTDLQIRIEILAGQDFTTPRVSVDPGDLVELEIASPLSQSILILR